MLQRDWKVTIGINAHQKWPGTVGTFGTGCRDERNETA